MMLLDRVKKAPFLEWAPDYYTFLSAVLIVFAFPPWNFWPLIWICLVPWFSALDRAPTSKHAVAQGVWLSCFMSLGGFYWVAHAIQEFGNLPWILSLLCLLIFSLFGQLQFAVFAPLLKKLQKQNSVLIMISLALLYSGVDWILPKLFVDTLGHAFYQAIHLRQRFADI